MLVTSPVDPKEAKSAIDEIKEIDSSSSSSDNMFGSLIKNDGWNNLAKSVVAKEKSKEQSPLL